MFPQYHAVIVTALEIYIKKMLTVQRHNLWQYAIETAKKQQVDLVVQNEIALIFKAQNIDPHKFALDVYKLLNKTERKINAIRITGLPNSCKTLTSNCIVGPFVTCYMNNHGSENEFFMSNMLNKSIIQCEELYITIATAEDFKSVLAGQPIDIAKKFYEKQTLCRTPVVITSNYEKFGRDNIAPVDENALRLRCFNYRFNRRHEPSEYIPWQQFYLYLNTILSKTVGNTL